MALNLGTILQSSAAERPDKTALRLNDFALSYAQLDRAARGVAASLRARGIGPGERVAIMVPNVPEFTIAYFGILYAGCTVVPLNVLLSPPEVTYHLEDSGASLLFAHPFFGDPAKKGALGAGVPLIWAGGSEEENLAQLAAAAPIDGLHPTGGDDTAVILYTSGTTGRPKGAELTHSNLFVNCAFVVPRLVPHGPDAVALATLPLFHSFGQTCIQNATLASGGTFTLLPRFTPQDAFQIMVRDRVTLFAGVPTMYFALLHHPGAADFDLSHLEYCLCGGAPMPVEVMQAFEKKYGVQILEGFGLSETSPVASFNMLDRPRKVGSIGYPVWGVEMAIFDDSDQPVADGERGEIVVRGHNVMKGYWQRPEANAEALRGGWFHTGVTVIGDVAALGFKSGSGDLSFGDVAGSTAAKVASGDVEGGAVGGDLSVHSASGDVHVGSVGGATTVRTASGDTELGRVAGSVQVTTASGDVEIERAEAGRLNLKTVSGDVTVGVATGTRVWLDLGSTSGDAISELDGSDGGDASLEIRAASVSGDILVRRAKGDVA